MTIKLREKYRKLLSQEKALLPPAPRSGIPVALGYPNRYRVGMSNLGFQVVYRLLNSILGVFCERFFLPDREDQLELERTRKPLFTLESATPVTEFPVVAFSLSFEEDYLNAIRMLRLAKIPLLRQQRDESSPLIIFGGPCCFINPEPIAPFADLICVGEGEVLIPQLLRELTRTSHRAELEDRLAERPGFYLPERYRVTYYPDGRIERITPSPGAPFPVKRVFLKRITESHLPFSPLLTPGAEFSNMSLIELSRGCAMGCRFCWAGYNYLPLRFTPLKGLLKRAKAQRGLSDRIGLISTSVGTYPYLEELIKGLKELRFRSSVSSLRIDALREDLIRFLTASGTRSLSLAPESGTDRLRFLINKRVTNEEIIRQIKPLFDWGVQRLKLYFLIGLPTEREEDIKAIAELVGEIRHIMLTAGKPRGRVGSINVSVNCFVPKPFTPFQWLPMEGEKSLKGKIEKLRRWLTPLNNVRSSFASPRLAQLQAILSRGDRRVANLLLATEENRGDWKKALRQGVINPDFYLIRQRGLNETLPWEVIDNGISKEELITEYLRALSTSGSIGEEGGK